MQPDQVFPSPDGHFRVEIYVNTMLQSHEVCNAYLYQNEPLEIVFANSSLWDASEICWTVDSRQVEMVLKCYPNGKKIYHLTINLTDRTAILTENTKQVLAGTITHVGSKLHDHAEEGMPLG